MLSHSYDLTFKRSFQLFLQVGKTKSTGKQTRKSVKSPQFQPAKQKTGISKGGPARF